MFGRLHPAWLAFGGSLVLLAVMGFLLWWSNTAFFDALVSHQLGVNVGIEKSIPLTPATAGIYGLLSDVLLDWACARIPFLKGRIPDGATSTPR